MSDMNPASCESLGDNGPGASPASGSTPLYSAETNLRARLTKFPKLDDNLARESQD